MVVVAVAAAAEWLRHPHRGWVSLSWGAFALGVVCLWPARTLRQRACILALLALALSGTIAQLQLDAIETDWASQRERRVNSASALLGSELHAALSQADRLAATAAAAANADRPQAFDRLARALPDHGPELGVAILEPSGVPWAWAGRHRLRPEIQGDSIAARVTGYYVILETRRHLANGRAAVASALIWAHPVVPDRARSLAHLFRERTEVGLLVFHPDSAPNRSDIFDYQEPTTAGPRVLFSVQPVPPEQGAAKELVVRRGSTVLGWLVLVTVVMGLFTAVHPAERCVLLGALLWAAARSSLGTALNLGSLFSPGTFFRPVLGALSQSAGVLALTGALATLGGVALWRLRLPRRWYGVAAGALLLSTAPYLFRDLGRGITPPAQGVSTGLWLMWELTLVLTVSAVIIIAAALFRGDRPATLTPWRLWVGVALAFVAATIGVFIWGPRGGWPNWYTFLWVPALFLVTLPAPRWAAITGIALVAGSAAALVTWGAVLEGRVDVAGRDVARLGDEPDPLAVPLLERFADQLVDAEVPSTSTELYALWRSSALRTEDYPVRLALWSREGEPRLELALDSLDLPPSLLATVVRNLDSTVSRQIARVLRVPGTHFILLSRLAPDAVITVAIGPRTRLLTPHRLTRLLHPGGRGAGLYAVTLSLPVVGEIADPVPVHWIREGWRIKSERTIALPGGVRHVHAEIDLRGPLPVLVRGILVVFLDVGVLALLWVLSEALAGQRIRVLLPRQARRSFQMRLAVTLAAFFILPAAGFAGWNFARLGDEARRARDLSIAQTLRDAILTAGTLAQAPPGQLAEGLLDLSRRIDADLALYNGGTLAGTSAPILEDLGVIEPLMDPVAFETLALEDESGMTRDGPTASLPMRVGYRVAQPAPPGSISILATPQLADDSSLADDQLDLAFVLLLATLAGAVAALLGAQTAARALSRPVADLRRLALALGRGQGMPEPSRTPPVEFEPVFGAFERMAADIRASQRALEEARRRTATVLATVATGVIALDDAGRLLIANPRAAELLGNPLPEGAPFDELFGEGWSVGKAAVQRYLSTSGGEGEALELDAQGRRLRLQFARLGSELGGVVLAVDDLTGVFRAERVLAWGEMARQVAHEIKNPLTPMRLGVQHLRRAYRNRRERFDETLEATSERILAEIDRLDTIARAFSRFGAPGEEAAPLETVELTTVAAEVAQLYRLAEEGTKLELVTDGPAPVWARKDEVKEVLVNLLENARNAGARRIVVSVAPGLLRVEDDGCGISEELLPRIFEPRFSTNTSGSGLGLAIVRRLVESWGARIEVESEVGRGTRMIVWMERR